MSVECGDCEADGRGPHLPGCKFVPGRNKSKPWKWESVDAAILEKGRRLERKRIRRAQAVAIAALRRAATELNRPTLMNVAHAIDTATRKGTGRKKR